MIATNSANSRLSMNVAHSGLLFTVQSLSSPFISLGKRASSLTTSDGDNWAAQAALLMSNCTIADFTQKYVTATSMTVADMESMTCVGRYLTTPKVVESAEVEVVNDYGVSIATQIVAALSSFVPGADSYALDNDTNVIEFSVGSERIVCVVRDGYFNVMWRIYGQTHSRQIVGQALSVRMARQAFVEVREHVTRKSH